MTGVTHNHAQYEQRLAYIKEILANYLSGEVHTKPVLDLLT